MKHAHNFKDVTGQTFGYLTAIRPVGTKSYFSEKYRREIKRSVWLFRCVCGKEIERTRREITNHISKGPQSCGCQIRVCGNQHSHWKGHGEIPLTYFSRLKDGARKGGHRNRNIPFNLSIEYLWELFLKQDRKCVFSGEELVFGTVAQVKNKETRRQTASLDRIDSSKGYVKGNVQWIHKVLNQMKSDLPQTEFIEWCRKVFQHSS